ncbi:helix-turn-helix domain-containing protein [Streptacidiphilus cavernicola]|uniref:Helix-turn-helix domain-containing protein n=1 Tax=Streptacidiphilus cavernicola TaxID=3342716 RepID=A0ABV6VNF4_9ACTN
MVGGRSRARPPRQLTDDPEAWPQQPGADVAAEAVRYIASTLAQAMDEQGLSLRATAEGSGVNRQAIADLLSGLSWPDVATVARLAAFTGAGLWPPQSGTDRSGKH